MPPNIQQLDMEKRKINFERKIEDEQEATACIEEAMKTYLCKLHPQFDEQGNLVQMYATTDEPDSEESRKNIEDFSEYVAQVKEQYRVEFTPLVLPINGKPELQILLLVTW